MWESRSFSPVFLPTRSSSCWYNNYLLDHRWFISIHQDFLFNSVGPSLLKMMLAIRFNSLKARKDLKESLFSIILHTFSKNSLYFFFDQSTPQRQKPFATHKTPFLWLSYLIHSTISKNKPIVQCMSKLEKILREIKRSPALSRVSIMWVDYSLIKKDLFDLLNKYFFSRFFFFIRVGPTPSLW